MAFSFAPAQVEHPSHTSLLSRKRILSLLMHRKAKDRQALSPMTSEQEFVQKYGGDTVGVGHSRRELEVDDPPDEFGDSIENNPDTLLRTFCGGGIDEDPEECKTRTSVNRLIRLFLIHHRRKKIEVPSGNAYWRIEDGQRTMEVSIENFCLLQGDRQLKPWACIASVAFDWARKRSGFLTEGAAKEYESLKLPPVVSKWCTPKEVEAIKEEREIQSKEEEQKPSVQVIPPSDMIQSNSPNWTIWNPSPSPSPSPSPIPSPSRTPERIDSSPMAAEDQLLLVPSVASFRHQPPILGSMDRWSSSSSSPVPVPLAIPEPESEPSLPSPEPVKPKNEPKPESSKPKSKPKPPKLKPMPKLKAEPSTEPKAEAEPELELQFKALQIEVTEPAPDEVAEVRPLPDRDAKEAAKYERPNILAPAPFGQRVPVPKDQSSPRQSAVETSSSQASLQNLTRNSGTSYEFETASTVVKRSPSGTQPDSPIGFKGIQRNSKEFKGMQRIRQSSLDKDANRICTNRWT